MVVAGSQERVLEASVVSGKVKYWRNGFETMGVKVVEVVHGQVGRHRVTAGPLTAEPFKLET